jgi:hypothetical protein
MKYKSISLLIFCVSLAAPVLAQSPSKGGDDQIRGGGTPNFIPQFIKKNKLGNSNIFQSPNGNVGIGTTNPNSALQVVSKSTDFSISLFGISPAKSGIGVFGRATATDVSGTNQPFGVVGIVDAPFGAGVAGTATSIAPNANAVGVSGRADTPLGIGVLGFTTPMTGNGIGVVGDTNSPDGVGVLGNHPSTEGGGQGVRGQTNSTTGFTVGTTGAALGTSGPGVGVFGQSYSLNGTGGLFTNVAGGTILEGGFGQPETTVFRVDGTGRVFADGGFQPSGADFAESMAVTGDRTRYGAGDLLVIDPTANRRLALAQQPYSTLVAGIYSTKPGMLGSNRKLNEAMPQDEVPLGVMGIVPCKVTAENGPIHMGDLLVTSSTPGHAMKGTDRNRMLGAVVGKALEPLPRGTGVIQVLVTLQ